MIEALLLFFCLIVVFFIKHKKLKTFAIFQAVFAVFISALVLFFLPNSIFENLSIKIMGKINFEFFQTALFKSTFLGIIPTIDIIEFSVFLLLVLSIFEFVDFVKELINSIKTKYIKVDEKCFFVIEKLHDFVVKIYLLFCRLLN